MHLGAWILILVTCLIVEYFEGDINIMLPVIFVAVLPFYLGSFLSEKHWYYISESLSTGVAVFVVVILYVKPIDLTYRSETGAVLLGISAICSSLAVVKWLDDELKIGKLKMFSSYTLKFLICLPIMYFLIPYFI